MKAQNHTIDCGSLDWSRPNKEIARLYGLRLSVVGALRAQHDPAYVKWRRTKQSVNWNKVDWSKSDTQLGYELNCTRENIRQWRVKLHKPASPNKRRPVSGGAGGKLKSETFVRVNFCKVCTRSFPVKYHMEKQLCSYDCQMAWFKQKIQSPDNKSSRIAKIREAKLGVARTTPNTKRGSPLHFCATECFLRSPNNVVYWIRNITEFVRSHPTLFDPDDLINKSTQRSSYASNATRGLQSITRAKAVRGSWKGWLRVSRVEYKERFDLIGRNELLHQGSTARYDNPTSQVQRPRLAT